LRSPTFEKKYSSKADFLLPHSACGLATLRFWCECATQHQMSRKKHERIEGETVNQDKLVSLSSQSRKKLVSKNFENQYPIGQKESKGKA